MSREDDVVAAFVSMAGSLVSGDDVTDLLGTLASECARLLDVSAAGMLLADRRGALHVVAASSERAADLEAFQAQRGQGPCHDCYNDGRPVLVPDVAAQPPDAVGPRHVAHPRDSVGNRHTLIEHGHQDGDFQRTLD